MIVHLLPLSFLVIFPGYATSSANESERFANCGRPFQCANIGNLSYPFWGGNRDRYCGHPKFGLKCNNDDYPQIVIEEKAYLVLSINHETSSLKVVRSEFWDSLCPSDLSNATLDTAYFSYSSNSENLTLFYGCTTSSLYPNRIDCAMGGPNTTGYYLTRFDPPFDVNFWGMCGTSIMVQVNRSAAEALPHSRSSINTTLAIRSGFELDWEADNSKCEQCVKSGGVCGSNQSSDSFVFACYCSDRGYAVSCGNDGDGDRAGNGNGNGRKSSNHTKTALAVAGGAIIGCLVLGFAIFACRKRTKRIVNKSPEFGESKTEDIPFAYLSKSLTSSTITTNSTSFSQSIVSSSSSHSETGKTSSYFGIHVFNYIELEKATDNFNSSREIGDGGFGTVFYGRLEDGREVAVKRLYENSLKRVEQFMNEVEILTRLSHVNLVKLYGCTSRRSRELLLVYEYISNGTVADHLFGKRANSGLLSWPIRLSIALETADALTYLHRSDIIHRDVKTTNILLENDFRVKVADFGLSRLFPNDVTHVSTAPQGTPGYVDPEYYQLYHLTEKSDVYSFGVVLAELISSKQAVDITRDRHDINLSNMALNKIHDHKLHELVDPSLGFSTNKSVKKMITSVAEIAFRCLQKERDMRPTMGEVLEALRRIKKGDSIASTVELMDIA